MCWSLDFFRSIYGCHNLHTDCVLHVLSVVQRDMLQKEDL